RAARTDPSDRSMVAAAFQHGTSRLMRGMSDSTVGRASSDGSDIKTRSYQSAPVEPPGSAHRLVDLLLDVVVVRGLVDLAVVLAEDALDRSRIVGLELQEQGRATGRQAPPALLDEGAVDPGRGCPADGTAGDGADDRPDREHEEQQAAEHRADDRASLRPGRRLVVEGDLALGVLAHDRGVLEPELAGVLDR